MTSPYEAAALRHAAYGMAITFREAIEAHAFTGYVFITPRLFLLGRQVGSDWPSERLCDPWQADPDGDAWHVFLAAGELGQAVPLIPHHLPFLSFFRNGRFRRMPLERFLELLP